MRPCTPTASAGSLPATEEVAATTHRKGGTTNVFISPEPPPVSDATQHANAGIISYDNTKAGLQNVDKARTEALIRELSEGSPFYANEQRKAAARERKVEEMLKKAQVFDQTIWQPYQQHLQHQQKQQQASSDPKTGVAALSTRHASLRANMKYAELANAVERMERELLAYGDALGLQQEKVFVHLDMDMFYAACEEKKDPSLKAKPLGVGSNAMLSTTNYVARQYGVRSGMPGFIGKKLCPTLIITPCDYSFYKKEAEAVRDVVRRYDPEFSAGGWDELTMELSAYLAARHEEQDADSESSADPNGATNEDAEDGSTDHTAATATVRSVALGETRPFTQRQGTDTPTTAHAMAHRRRMRRKYAAAAEVVAELREKIFAETQLTASAGIAPTSTLAKIASNYNKPNGQHLLALYSRKDVMDFMHGLSCRQVPGIGKSQEHILHGLGIKTVGDIYRNRVLLFHLITPKTYEFLLSTSLGVGGMFHDEREDTVAGEGKHKRAGSADEGHGHNSADCAEGENPEEVGWNSETRKSIGQERTFYKLKNALELETIARQNLMDAVRGMQKKGLLTRQMVLKLKHVNFQVKQYSRNVTPATDDLETLQRTLNALMTPIAHCYADYRLLGVRLEKLISRERFEWEQNSANGEGPFHHQQQPTLLDFVGKQQQQQQQQSQLRKRPRSPSAASYFSISDEDDTGAEEHESLGVELVEPPQETRASDGVSRSGEKGSDVERNASSLSVEVVDSPVEAPAPREEGRAGALPTLPYRKALSTQGMAEQPNDDPDDDVIVIE